MLPSEAQEYLEIVRKRGAAKATLNRVYYNVTKREGLFLVAYALVISMACAYTANTLRRRFKAAAAIGFVLAWAQFLAAGLDAVENAALIRLLLGSSHSFYPLVAWVCAGIKFGLVGLGLAYLPAGFILGRLVRRS